MTPANDPISNTAKDHADFSDRNLYPTWTYKKYATLSLKPRPSARVVILKFSCKTIKTNGNYPLLNQPAEPVLSPLN